MGHLGSFGAAVKELDPSSLDTFDFFGETFTVSGVIPSMLMLQLGASATGKIEEAEGLAAVWEAMRCSLTTPEQQITNADGVTTIPADGSEFSRFYKLAVAHCCELEDLMRLTNALFEAQSGRPTEGPQGSSPGPSATSPSSSTSSSPPPGFAHLTPVARVLDGSLASPSGSPAT